MTASTGNDGAPVVLHVVEDHQRNRLTTFFRGILAIPHFIVLYFLNIAVFVVVFITWWAALFTGRAPEGLRTFVTGILRWQARVGGYYSLLTDQYPPFSFDAGNYPIDVEFPPPGHLNRLAVLFRVILVIPAAILSFVTGIVHWILVFIAWLSGVFAGKVPAGIYGTIAGTLQFSSRFSSYYFLVTPTYPGQPFGPASLSRSGGGQAPASAY